MSVSDRARKALERLGMTGSEIRAYAALLRSGESTAAELSQSSGIPYSKIYDVLGSLDEGGWASADDSRPTRYTASPPATGLDAARQRIESEYAEDRAAVSSELGPLYERTGAAERPDIWFLHGAANILSKVLEMVDVCRSEVMIAVPGAGHALARQALPKLRHLRDRGVDVSVLASDEADAESLRALSRVARVRVRGGMFGGGVISDRRQVVILLGQEGAEAVAVWADHPGLAGFAREYFEYLIKDSRPA